MSHRSKRKIAQAVSSSTLTLTLMGGITFLISACSGDAGKVTGQFAPKTEMTTKLDSCAQSKLSGSLQTFQAPPTKVCRKGSDGEAVDKDVVPSFQMVAKKGRLGIDHIAAFKISYKVASSEISDEVKMTTESSVQQFLSSVCGPVIQSPFKRSSLATRFTFRPLRPTDRMASAKTRGAKASTSSDDAFFNGQIAPRVEAVEPSAEGAAPQIVPEKSVAQPPAKAQPIQTLDPNAINSILELVISEDSSISIKDDLSELSSGSLKSGLAEGAAPTEQQLLFCGQLLVRMAESVGLTKGRDCESLEKASAQQEATSKAADATTTAESSKNSKPTPKVADDRLMKPGGHGVASLPTLKLAQTEVLEILTPVCGDLNPKPSPTPAGKNP